MTDENRLCFNLACSRQIHFHDKYGVFYVGKEGKCRENWLSLRTPVVQEGQVFVPDAPCKEQLPDVSRRRLLLSPARLRSLLDQNRFLSPALPLKSRLQLLPFAEMHPHQAFPELAVVGDEEVEQFVDNCVVPEVAFKG